MFFVTSWWPYSSSSVDEEGRDDDVENKDGQEDGGHNVNNYLNKQGLDYLIWLIVTTPTQLNLNQI